jgi:hypothetical protein
VVGGLALLAAGLLVATWDWRRRRTTDLRWSRGLGAAALAVGVGLAVPAALVYVASWTPWLVRFDDTRTGRSAASSRRDGLVHLRLRPIGDRLAGLATHHRDVARFHLTLDADHPYRAPATTWPVQARPVVYHWTSCGVEDDPADCEVAPGNAAEVVALGNPVLWWGGLALLPLLVAGAVRRDGRSSVPLAFLAAQYLPWLVVARPVFSFYAVPLVPFLAAGVAVVCGELDRPLRRLATVTGTATGGAVGAVGAVAGGADRFGVGTAAVVLAVAGAAIGAAVDDRRPPRDDPGRGRRDLARRPARRGRDRTGRLLRTRLVRGGAPRGGDPPALVVPGVDLAGAARPRPSPLAGLGVRCIDADVVARDPGGGRDGRRLPAARRRRDHARDAGAGDRHHRRRPRRPRPPLPLGRPREGGSTRAHPRSPDGAAGPPSRPSGGVGGHLGTGHPRARDEAAHAAAPHHRGATRPERSVRPGHAGAAVGDAPVVAGRSIGDRPDDEEAGT